MCDQVVQLGNHKDSLRVSSKMLETRCEATHDCFSTDARDVRLEEPAGVFEQSEWLNSLRLLIDQEDAPKEYYKCASLRNGLV